jgi:hypothetical protein
VKAPVDVLSHAGVHWVGDGFPVRTVFFYEQRGPGAQSLPATPALPLWACKATSRSRPAPTPGLRDSDHRL